MVESEVDRDLAAMGAADDGGTGDFEVSEEGGEVVSFKVGFPCGGRAA
jgi:hypothetical protein